MKLPFDTSGIVLKGIANKNSNGTLNDIQAGITLDDNGNIIFKDDYVSNYLKKDYITLAELYNKSNALSYREGKLYFKVNNKEYSLEEIVNNATNLKKNLSGGSLWWASQIETDHRNCANIPKTNNESDKENIYWSIDKFISDSTGSSICDQNKSISFYDKMIDSESGKWKWLDVKNLEIVVPAIEDSYKMAMIIVKLAYNQKMGNEPIVFRLYDATIGKELSRISIVQNGKDYINYNAPLVYMGPLEVAKFTSINQNENTPNDIVCVEKEDCGCIETTCVDGDPNCITPNISYIDKKYEVNSHLIKVQFHVADFQDNYWNRYFGSDIDNTAASTSSINVLIFNTAPNTDFFHKQGTVTFNKSSKFEVIFDNEVGTANYSIALSCSKNVNLWFSNKSTKGFTINSEIDFQGFVDWTITKN